jgi:hypothetical protein
VIKPDWPQSDRPFRRFVKSFVAIPSIRHVNVAVDGKRTLANAAVASVLHREALSREQCGTPSRELETIASERHHPAPQKFR